MDPQTLNAILDLLWPELPQLMGDAWPAVEPQLVALRGQLTGDDKVRSAAQLQIMRLLRHHPAVLDRLHRLSHVSSSERYASPAPPPPTTRRYTDISCPNRVWVRAERFTAVVRLTHRPREGGEHVTAADFDPGQPVMVHVTAPNFELLSANDRRLVLDPVADSEVTFDFRPGGDLGRHPVDFEFLQRGVPAAVVRVTVEVTAEVTAGAPARRLETLVRFDGGAPPPDLVLHITRGMLHAEPYLFFELYEPALDNRTDLGRVPFVDPRGAMDRLFAELSWIVDNVGDPTDAEIRAELQEMLEGLGYRLWADLVPADLKQLYRTRREEWAGKSLLLLTDEPYIPWELVWPWDKVSRSADELPWGGSLRMLRWLRGDPELDQGYDGPPSTVPVWPVPQADRPMPRPDGVIALAVPGRTLRYPEEECAVFVQGAAVCGFADRSPAEARRRSLLNLLKAGGTGWLHIAAHGSFDGEAPDLDSSITLAKSDALTPAHLLHPAIAGQIYAARPGFFLNTCDSGRQAWTISRLGGWANRLIDNGAGLLIAPMWPVDDRAAHDFAVAFYTALFAGATVADASQMGREAARQTGDPSWLAYSVYAHPNARLAFPQPA